MEGARVLVLAESAELVGKSTKLMETYAAVAAELQRIGAVALAANVVKEQRKEARRLRKISAMNTGVLVALNNDREAHAAEERKRLRLLREMHDTHQSLSATKAQLKLIAEILRNTRMDLLDTEQALEAKRAVKAFSLFDLGDGRPKGGGVDGKKNRAQVLDRLPRLGVGISAEQRNDFMWFKDTWDKKMLEEHGPGWPVLFVGWAQRLINQHETGDRRAFIVFMHEQSTRCVGDDVALVVP